MTLKQKRETVRRFQAFESVPTIAADYWNKLSACRPDGMIEQVLRDYMNGKFKLAKESGKKA